MQQEIKLKRIAELHSFFEDLPSPLTPEALIPAEVEQDYIPSGKSARKTIPVLIVIGFFGIVAGYLCFQFTAWLSLGVYRLFDDAGACLSILFYPAGFVYVLSPLAIALCTGIGLGMSGKLAACRNPLHSEVMGILFGLMSAAVAIRAWKELLRDNGLNLIASVIDHLEPSLNTIVIVLIHAVCEAIVTMFHSYPWMAVLATASFAGTFLFAMRAADSPYCETAQVPMMDEIVMRIPLKDIAFLLLGIIERDAAKLSQVTAITGIEAQKIEKIQRLDLIYWTAKGRHSNLIEVRAHYTKAVVSTNKVKQEKQERLIYSEWVSRDDTLFFQQYLHFESSYA